MRPDLTARPRPLPCLLNLVIAVTSLLAAASGAAQTTPCGPPPSIMQLTAPNIFSEQQEQWLGEAMADYDDRFSRPARNPALNAYLNTIGARLLAVLPPTRLQFHFTIVEAAEVNGFSRAGGQVYLTRKLIASAHSEDEIAGVIAHEMGHILTHQFAIETTADLHRLLGVDSVTDRADVYAKFQRLTDARQHQKHQTDSETDDKQDQADRVAVYASAAAGYRPLAYAEFWDRSFFVGGKTGNRFSDFFGATKPSEKRLRKIRAIIAELPPTCGTSAVANVSPAFKQWQQAVLEDQYAQPEPPAIAVTPTPTPPAASTTTTETPASAAPASATLTSAKPGETELQLTPPLRLDIERLRFSRDGKYILAQDESSIFVLSREPFKELFRIDADRAVAAEFTPDSQELVFITPGLHMERWNIADHKLVAAHEVVAQQNCLQMHLAPDGRTIACVFIVPDNESYAGNLGFVLIDVDTGQVLFKKKPWFAPNFNFEFSLFARRLQHDTSDVLTSSLSADGNLFVIGPGSDRLAFDLRTRTPIKLEGALKSFDYPVSYCFLGNDRIVAIHAAQFEQSGIFSFPEGKRLKQVKLGFPYLYSTAGGQLVVTQGPKDSGAAVALADLDLSKFVAGSKSFAVDAFGGSWISENPDGSLAIRDLNSANSDAANPKEWPRVYLSLSPLAPASSVSLSTNGRYLAFSARTRGTIWDLDTGKSAILIYGFRNSWWAPDGSLLAEFIPHEKTPRRISSITMGAAGTVVRSSDMTYTLSEQAHLEQGHLLEWKQEKNHFTFTASSPFDAKQQWARAFENGRPGYTTNFADSDLILSYPILTPLAKEKLRTEAALREQADAIKEKPSGRIIELVNSADGTPRGDVVVEVPRSYDGVDGFSHVGDLLYLSTGDNRTIVYSFKTGAQLRQFFGTVISADTASGIVCAVNRRDELIVIDKTGTELQHRSFGSPVRFAELRDNGTQLVVLTADQKIRRLKIEAK